MLNSTNTPKSMSDTDIKYKFIVIYDKFTKPMAVSLRNSISKEYTCAICDKKVYEQNEPKLSNKNNLILLDEDLINTNLANPSLKSIRFSEGVLIKHEKNTLGIYIDPDADLGSFKQRFQMSWKKYLTGIVAPILLIGGIPTAIVIAFMMFYNDRKKVKFKLMFEAVNKLKINKLEDFLYGRNFG